MNEWMNVFIYRTYHILSQGGLQSGKYGEAGKGGEGRLARVAIDTASLFTHMKEKSKQSELKARRGGIC